jgi:hypothetical protein
MISALALAAILSASQFAAEVQHDGAKTAVSRLAAGGDWQRALDAIAAGAPDWIALAPDLSRGADSAIAPQVGQALAKALPLVPAEVLAVADLQRRPGTGIQWVCGAHFVDMPAAERARYLADTREAVAAVPQLAGGRARELCLKELAQAAEH